MLGCQSTLLLNLLQVKIAVGKDCSSKLSEIYLPQTVHKRTVTSDILRFHAVVPVAEQTTVTDFTIKLTGTVSQMVAMDSNLPDGWLYVRILAQLVGTAGTVGEFDIAHCSNFYTSGLLAI